MWKYNESSNTVDEQPTMDKPDMKDFPTEVGGFEFMNAMDNYEKHLASLRSIPVQGKVKWDHGEDVTGKFSIETKHPGLYEKDFAKPHRKAYNSVKEMFNDIANGRDDVPDLQQQALEHISDYDLFNWDEALTENEFSYLLDLLMKFNPLCPPGSIGFEDQKRHIKNQSQEQPIKKEENS